MKQFEQKVKISLNLFSLFWFFVLKLPSYPIVVPTVSGRVKQHDLVVDRCVFVPLVSNVRWCKKHDVVSAPTSSEKGSILSTEFLLETRSVFMEMSMKFWSDLMSNHFVADLLYIHMLKSVSLEGVCQMHASQKILLIYCMSENQQPSSADVTTWISLNLLQTSHDTYTNIQKYDIVHVHRKLCCRGKLPISWVQLLWGFFLQRWHFTQLPKGGEPRKWPWAQPRRSWGVASDRHRSWTQVVLVCGYFAFVSW